MDDIVRILFFLFIYISTLYIGFTIGRISEMRRTIKLMDEELEWLKEFDKGLEKLLLKRKNET